MKQSLTRYIATVNTELNNCLLHVEQELGDNVTLQEIEVVSTQNITKVKCPMIFKRFFFS